MSLRQRMERILRGPDKAEVMHDALTTPIETGLPTTWKDGAGKVHLPSKNTVVKVANAGEVAQFGFAPTRVCGTCRHFDLTSAARKALIEQRFGERLVHDEKWRLEFLGVPMEHVGLCGPSGGERATTSISNAGSCDMYTPVRFREGQ